MSSRTPDSIDVDLCRRRSRRGSAPCGWHARLRPCAPALLGLALMVFLWGLGYKLSLYHHAPSHGSRTTIAKLWTDPRAPQLASGSVSTHPEHSPSAGPALFATAAPLPPLPSVAAAVSGFVPETSGSRRSLIRPRSPPPSKAV